jgi:hypothetical protein
MKIEERKNLKESNFTIEAEIRFQKFFSAATGFFDKLFKK